MEKVYILGGAQTDFERNWTKEGKGVIVVSHNPEITKYCDVLLKISGGKLNEEKKND